MPDLNVDEIREALAMVDSCAHCSASLVLERRKPPLCVDCFPRCSEGECEHDCDDPIAKVLNAAPALLARLDLLEATLAHVGGCDGVPGIAGGGLCMSCHETIIATLRTRMDAVIERLEQKRAEVIERGDGGIET